MTHAITVNEHDDRSYHGGAAIRFYSTKGEHGYLSNFFKAPFVLDGKEWRTTEHYYQAQKVAGTPREEEIRAVASPMVAARMGRSRQYPLRSDWESIKLDVMRRAVLAKFEQNPDLLALLLATGDALLVEHSKRDRFYGDGGDGTGANWLGRILVETRTKLRNAGR